MDAQTTLTLCCSACGALAQASCNCGAPYTYLSPGKLAVEAIKNNPGMSDRAIADKLGIDNSTVSKARKATVGNPTVDGKRVGKDGKARRAPRKRKDNFKQEANAANQVRSGAKTQKEAAQGAGLGSVQGVKLGEAYTQGRHDAFVEIGADADFSKITAQQKRDAALRVYAKALDRQFEERVQFEYTARVKKNFPNLDKMQREASEEKRTYERLSRERKHIMSVTDFMFVLSCLHPDSRASVSEGRLKRAFQMLEPKKFAITGEK